MRCIKGTGVRWLVFVRNGGRGIGKSGGRWAPVWGGVSLSSRRFQEVYKKRLCAAQVVYGQSDGHGVLSRRLTAVSLPSAVRACTRRAVGARRRAGATSCSPHLGHRSPDPLKSSASDTRRGDTCLAIMYASPRQATDQARCPRSRPRRTETSVEEPLDVGENPFPRSRTCVRR
jgi:hypothetical protein